MVNLKINNQDTEVAPGTTILQACEQLGIEIPHFCYHPRLSIAGNCRMCLVEVERSPKPVASCAMPVSEGMVVHTDTPKVEAARHGVLEFLLINHPLDCPICDQGGECDLQDLTLEYGSGKSRFDLNKRAVADKEMGPLIKTIMTRCIHCTRCIRFATEIAGVPEIGSLGRGEDMEITTYLERSMTSELSANVIDICPVGALTNKPYAFKGRSWELTHTPSIDVLDAVGSHIRIDSREQEIMRILPRINDAINEEWISDKTRYAFDGLKYQRLDRPYVRKNGKLKAVSWDEAFQTIRDKMVGVSNTEIAAIAGDLADCEAMVSLKDLWQRLGSPHLECRQDGSVLDGSSRGSYLFNTTIAGIERADACLLISTNPRYEAALLNARLYKRYRAGGFKVASIGPMLDLNYDHEHLGDTVATLKDIADGRHAFAKTLAQSQAPMLILGPTSLNRRDGWEILLLAQKVASDTGMLRSDWNGFNVLHTAASRVGGLDLGFLPQKGAVAQYDRIKIVYLLGADEMEMRDLGQAFVIYQGHHGDAGAHRADVILPGAAYTEKSATYVNLEGRPQQTAKAVAPPGEAKEDWKIISELSEVLGHPLPYKTLEEVRQRLVATNTIFADMGEITPAAWKTLEVCTPETLSRVPFQPAINNFYMTDPISRHSPVMAQCIAAKCM
ncbi:MAG: NADH-quinone oxidoreductase subunit NuoG [Alphaproteobacteria bacterium]